MIQRPPLTRFAEVSRYELSSLGGLSAWPRIYRSLCNPPLAPPDNSYKAGLLPAWHISGPHLIGSVYSLARKSWYRRVCRLKANGNPDIL